MAGGKNGAPSYAERLIARARELHDSDAFEPARREDLVVSAAQAKALERADGHRARLMTAAFAAVAAVVAAFSLCLPYSGMDIMGTGGQVLSPGDVLDCYALWFQLNVMPLFDATLSNRIASVYADFQATHGSLMYTLVMARAQITFVVVLCGVMLAVAGLLFQTAFRNPLAAPTSLGVSDGVTLGCIVFSYMGYVSILDNPSLYLLLTYGLGALAVAAVLLLSRGISGGARYNVLDMLLLGTVVCQLLGGVNGFIQNFQMGSDAWYNFYEIQQATSAVESPEVCLAVVVLFVLTFVPALLLRFKLNLVAFSDDDGKMMGSRAGLLRAAALVLGSAMELGAIATIGQVAVLSLAVPFAVRYMLPADFRYQFLGNCLLGTVVLLVCVAIQHFATVGILTMPVGTIVSIFIVPVFVWMVAFGRGRW